MLARRSVVLFSRLVGMIYLIHYNVQTSAYGVCGYFFATQPKPLTEDMVEKIIKRDEELRKDYYSMPSSFPESSQPPTGKVTMVVIANRW